MRPCAVRSGGRSPQTKRHRLRSGDVEQPARPGIASPVRFSDSDVTPRAPAPVLGAHTDEVLRELLDAAIRAPSGQNAQRWAFVVLRDPEARRFFGERYRHWIHKLMGDRVPQPDDDSAGARSLRPRLSA